MLQCRDREISTEILMIVEHGRGFRHGVLTVSLDDPVTVLFLFLYG